MDLQYKKITLRKMNAKDPILRDFKIELSKASTKENLEIGRKKWHITYKESSIRWLMEISEEILQARRLWDDTF